MPDEQPQRRKTPKTSPRSVSRLAAVQALYQMDLANTDLGDVIQEFTDYRFSGPASQHAYPGAEPEFFSALLTGVVERQRDIDPMIDVALAEGWRLVRIDSILRAILRSGVFELLQVADVPARVVINEYINVAHAFFNEDEPRVVNGVLDRIARQVRAAEFVRSAEG